MSLKVCFKESHRHSGYSSTQKLVCKQERLQKILGKILRQLKLLTEMGEWLRDAQADMPQDSLHK